MKPILARVEKLEALKPDNAAYGVIIPRDGETADEAWTREHGDEPHPKLLVIVDRFCGAAK